MHSTSSDRRNRTNGPAVRIASGATRRVGQSSADGCILTGRDVASSPVDGRTEIRRLVVLTAAHAREVTAGRIVVASGVIELCLPAGSDIIETRSVAK